MVAKKPDRAKSPARAKRPATKKPATKKPPAAKTIEKVSQLRGIALVEKVIAEIERRGAHKTLGHAPKGLAESALAALTFPDGRPLPPSVRRWLAYDAELLDWFDDPARSALPPQTFHDMMVREFDEETADACDFSDMLPGNCYVVPGGSDSRAFLYVGKVDDAGEYPILLVDTDDVPFICVEYPGFDVYLAVLFDVIKLKGGNTYAAAFDDPTYGDAMAQQARLNLRGFKSFDPGGDSEHVDGPDAAEEALNELFGD